MSGNLEKKGNTWACVCFKKNFKIILICIWILKSDYRFFCSVQFSSFTQSCLTFRNPVDYSMLGFSVHHQLLELAKTHVHWTGDAIQSSHPLLSPSPPVFNLSQHQGLFQWVSSSHQVAKVLGLHPSSEYLGLISFRIDWFYLFAIKGTLKSLLQHHSSQASIPRHSAFFMAQLTSIHDHWKKP